MLRAIMRRKATLETLRSAVPAIAPSMLKCDFGNLHREVELLEAAHAPLLHTVYYVPSHLTWLLLPV